MSKSSFALCRVALSALALGAIHTTLWAQAVPNINSIAPASAAPLPSGSTSSVVITITGSNFNSPTVLFDGNVLLPPTVTNPASPSSVQAVVPASLLANPHLARVQVVNVPQVVAAAIKKSAGTGKISAEVPTSVAGPQSNTVLFPVSNKLTNLTLNPGTAFGSATPVAIATGDVNGDGITDAVVAGSDGSVLAYLGDGKGNFNSVVSTTLAKPALAVAATDTAVAIALGDFNGDGILDLVRADAITNTSGASSSVTILLGDGQGNFTPLASGTGTAAALPAGISALMVTDLNSDGALDVGYTIQSPDPTVSGFYTLLGDGTGGFEVSNGAIINIQTPVAAQSSAVASGDFNSDGFVDVLVADSGSNIVTLLLGGGISLSAPTFPIPAPPTSITVGDFNNDGNNDFATINSDGSITVYLGDGTGNFNLFGTAQTDAKTAKLKTAKAQLVKASAAIVGMNAQSVIANGDFNADGFLDLAVNDGTNITILLGDGTGNFTQATQAASGGTTAPLLALADVNSDGALDVLANTANGTTPFTNGGTAGGAPTLTVPASLDFGSVNVGTPTPKVVTITNSGTVTVNFSGAPTLTGANAGDFAVSANTCTGALNSAATCTTTITFTPSIVGAETAVLTFTDDAGTQAVNLTGTGLAVATASITPATLTFTTNVGSTSAAQTITVTNTGGAALAISTVTSSGAPFAITANTCSTSVAANGTCTVSVTFAPTAAGSASGSITFTDNSSTGTSQSVSLMGTGVGTPVATVSPTMLSFGNQNVGSTSAAQTITLKNTGTAPLSITSVTGSGTPFAISANTCGTSSLAVGASCTVSVTFAPTAASSAAGTITFTDNSSPTTQTVALSGTGVSATGAKAVVTPASLSFGNVNVGGTSGVQLVTIHNTGTANLTVTAVKATAPFEIIGNSCVGTLGVNRTCAVEVAFHPTAAGAATGTLTFTDNSVLGTTQTVALSGTGVTPVAAVSPASLTFAAQSVGTSSAAQTVTLSNTGSGTLSINYINASGDFQISARTCGTTLAAGATCTVSVVFHPTAAGTRTGTLTFSDNSSKGATQTVALSGSGVTPVPVAAVSPTSLTFATQSVGTRSAPQVVTLSNTGVGPLSISSIKPSGDFQISAQTCGATLAAGSTCTVSVVFDPTAAGTRTGTLTFSDNSSKGATQTVSLTGTGILRRIAPNPGFLVFFSRLGTKSTPQTVTISNTGSAVVTFSGFTLAGSGAAKFSISANTCGATLAAGASCKVSVAFSSTTNGSFNGQLNVASDAPAVTVALTGSTY